MNSSLKTLRNACVAAALTAVGAEFYPLAAVEMNWDRTELWTASDDGKSHIEVGPGDGKFGTCLEVPHSIEPGGWAQIGRTMDGTFDEGKPVTFWIKAKTPAVLEIKFEDQDGSNFLKRIPLKNQYSQWTRLVVYRNNLEYGWGGDDKLGNLRAFYFALSGQGKGTLSLDQIGFGSPELEPSFLPAGPQLDPDRELPGIGFRQRRASQMIPENLLVLEWLKANQDASSPEKKLVSSMEDNIAQTFNNAITAMAFILKGERERAERILDFYASATDPDNQDPTLQNFYYKGEARGFFQSIFLTGNAQTAYHSLPSNDRWTGDMAWLLLACKHYEKTYASDRYAKLSKLLNDLLKSFYKPAATGGYIHSGWWRGDSGIHQDGYGEPNLDCYAAFKLTGEEKMAANLKLWLDSILKGDNLPLDNYTWRVLAFGKPAASALNTVEYDLRFRKTLDLGGHKAVGFFHAPDDVNNIWLDGIGHAASGYFAIGNPERGNFYSNQLDAFLIPSSLGGKNTKALPYTANKKGGYDWVDPKKGFVSVAVWYIFAKNRFNPLTLTRH